MSRKKGTQKTGGRAKGTPNKITTDLRTWINELLDKISTNVTYYNTDSIRES